MLPLVLALGLGAAYVYREAQHELPQGKWVVLDGPGHKISVLRLGSNFLWFHNSRRLPLERVDDSRPSTIEVIHQLWLRRKDTEGENSVDFALKGESPQWSWTYCKPSIWEAPEAIHFPPVRYELRVDELQGCLRLHQLNDSRGRW